MLRPVISYSCTSNLTWRGGVSSMWRIGTGVGSSAPDGQGSAGLKTALGGPHSLGCPDAHSSVEISIGT